MKPSQQQRSKTQSSIRGFAHRVPTERLEPNTVETTTPADAGAVREAPLSRGTFVVEDAATAQLGEGALVELRLDTR